MERKEINPWTWQDERHYVQAIEVKNPESTLYISGQTAIDAIGISSTADFKSQLLLTIANLEEVLSEAGYKNTDITRITLYTTSFDELGQNFGTIQEWITLNNIRTAITVVEVNKLFETTVVELEAIAAK
ncbi:RidA family protein [Ulvibacterium sp.]|uniref:RidA family protein n=1 Tax=Ulvibacterium sp. TaxID=2665914 RepID=UPI003BAB9B0F